MFFFGGCRAGTVSSPFPASRGCLHSLAHGPFHLQSHHNILPLILSSHLLWPTCFPLLFKKIFFIHGSWAWTFSSCSEQGLLSSWSAQASHDSGFSCYGAQDLGHLGSVVLARGLSCPMTCRIFLDQGSNPCPLHWQADSWSNHWTTREVLSPSCDDYIEPIWTIQDKLPDSRVPWSHLQSPFCHVR